MKPFITVYRGSRRNACYLHAPPVKQRRIPCNKRGLLGKSMRGEAAARPPHQQIRQCSTLRGSGQGMLIDNAAQTNECQTMMSNTLRRRCAPFWEGQWGSAEATAAPKPCARTCSAQSQQRASLGFIRA